MFEPDDAAAILSVSLAADVLPASVASQVATVTFSSESKSLRMLLKQGKVSDRSPESNATYRVDNHFRGFTPFNDPTPNEASAE